MERKKKVLIIDDEENFTQLVKLNLEQTGQYEVMAINQGALAVSSARQFKPDLIVLDVLMPDLQGDDIAYELEKDNSTKDIPIVFLTAAVTKEEVERHKGLIAKRPFIAKPVSAEELISYIEENIG